MTEQLRKTAAILLAHAEQGIGQPFPQWLVDCRRDVEAAVVDPSPQVHMGGVTYSQAEFDEIYEIGKRDGFEEAVQEIDQKTGGDGEYRVSIDIGSGPNAERHTPDAPAMIQRIVDRFEVLNLLDEATKTGSDQPDDSPNSHVVGREPAAYLIEWYDAGERRRVQLHQKLEPWLLANKPTITPLYAAEDSPNSHVRVTDTISRRDLLQRMSFALDDLSPDETIGYSNGVGWIEVATVEEIRRAAKTAHDAVAVQFLATEDGEFNGNEQPEPAEPDLVAARKWLSARWCVEHPNEGHVRQLAEYAASLGTPTPAAKTGGSDNETR